MLGRCLFTVAVGLFLVGCRTPRVEGGCRVKVSGAASGEFPCTLAVSEGNQGRVRLIFSPAKLPTTLGAFTAQIDVARGDLTGTGSKAVPVQVAALLVSSAERATFAAGRGKGTLGEVAVELEAGPKDGGDPRSAVEVKRGTVRAHLVAAPGTRGEVEVELRF